MPAVTEVTEYSISLTCSAHACPAPDSPHSLLTAWNAASTGPVPVAASVTSTSSWLSIKVTVAVAIALSPHCTCTCLSLKRSSVVSCASSPTMDSMSMFVISFFLSATSLKRTKALFSSSSDSSMPSSVSLERKAARPLCFPSTMPSFFSSPMVDASTISYVSLFLSIPSWWIPLSCAKALAPTMALFGCTGMPVSAVTSLLLRWISFLLMLVSSASESAGLPSRSL
mmetsp:Transcript_16365/g.41453  ORF Transcript_16365/g.41453 Transcript_16365/m.41453 type:complete len:227 (-) Transcript_16365:1170-1850(-)